MKGVKLSKRLLSLVLVLIMMLGFAVQASAVSDQSGDSDTIAFEEIDSDLTFSPSDREADEDDAGNDPAYADTDLVRVSIVLKKDSTIEAGFSTADIAENKAAMAYRARLETAQETVTDKIEAAIGEDLDVVWNLTLAADLISAYVEYGQIEEIEAVPGVSCVVIETQYEPAVVDTDEVSDPSMATSSRMIGSTTAYLEGYTGAGGRIAIIDTGIDSDHQSFDAGAYEYSLSLNAADADMSYEDYIASLDLLTAEKTASVWDELNISGLKDYSATDTYQTSKNPFAFNYVDENTDITHDNDSQGEHGSHVTGIAAANSYIPNGDGTYSAALDTVYTQGVAPDAQIITMKVFGAGGGAYDSDYMAAIEDAIILGADSVNLSLGSGNAGTSYESSSTVYQAILDSLVNSDTVVTMSAGNSYAWISNDGIGYLYADDVNLDTVGSPGSSTNSLAVASVDNDGFTGSGFTTSATGDTGIYYTESSGYSNAPFTTLASEDDYSYILIDGYGTEADFAALGDAVEGKIVFVSRGSTSFYQKANAAAEAGAIATIVYNNTAGTISMDLTGYSYTAPVISITQADGMAIMEGSDPVYDSDDSILYYTGTMAVTGGVSSTSYNSDRYTMSDFSSWGVPGSLELKPEITAPGGSIYSVNGDKVGGTAYETMSGTSMAAPQVAGMAALVAQYIKANDLDGTTGLTVRALSQSLLMSTAVPLYEEESGGKYYSVLKQGAGLANVGAAVTATSYILMDENATDSWADGKVKAELGDDPGEDGEYTFTYTINSLTDSEETYSLCADVFTQGLFSYYVNDDYDVGYYMDTWTAGLGFDVTWTVDGKELEVTDELANADINGDGLVNSADGRAILAYTTGEIGTLANMDAADLDSDDAITTYDAYLFFKALTTGYAVVPAGESVEVTVTIALTDETKAYLEENYTAGAYVEGYIYSEALATAEGVEGTCHSIPLLAFYGNWTDASMYDVGSFTQYCYGEEDRWNYLGSSYSNYVTVKYAGDSAAYYFGGNPFGGDDYDESKNALSSSSTLYKAVFALIRNAAGGKLTLTDETTGQVQTIDVGQLDGAYYYVNEGSWYNTSSSISLSDLVLDGSEGDRYTLALTLAPEYYAAYDENGTATIDYDSLGDGATLSISFTLDNSAPTVDGVTGSSMLTEQGALTVSAKDDQNVAAVVLYTSDGEVVDYELCDTSEAEVTFDTAGQEDGVYLLQVYDYAMNCTTCRVFMNMQPTDTVEGLTLSADSLSVLKGGTATLTASVLPVNVSDDTVTWTSSDESVATVSGGIVTGVNVGSCTITATSVLDTSVSAACTVEVTTIEKTLNGVVWDEDGSVWWSAFDVNDASNYTKLTGDASDVSVLSAACQDDTLYAQDTDGSFYSVDPETFDTTVIGSGVYVFADMAESYHLDGYILAAYGPYVLMVDPKTGSSAYTVTKYGTNITGITYCGSVLNSYTYVDCYYLTDQNGDVYFDAYMADGGNYYYFYGDDGLLFSTGIAAANSHYSSAYYDGEYLFYSAYASSTNTIYAIDVDDTGTAYEMSSFGDGVWPASGLFERSGITGAGGATASRIDAAGDLTRCRTASAETFPSLTESASRPTGSLNAVVINDTADSGSDLEEREDGATTVVVDQSATNGLVSVSYDPEVFALDDYDVKGSYTSVVSDTKNGVLTFAYVNLSGEDAEAALTFTRLDPCVDSTITTTCLETGAAVDHDKAVSTTLTVPAHIADEAVVENEIAPTCTEDGSYESVVCCTVCGEELSRETVPVPTTGHTEGEAVQEKVTSATCTEDGSYESVVYCTVCGEELSRKTVAVPATGHSYDKHVFSWLTDYSGCTAVFTCEVCGEELRVACRVNSTVDEDGSTVYTAVVTLDGVTYTSDPVTVPAASPAPDNGSTDKNGGDSDSNNGDSAMTVLWVVLAAAAIVGCAVAVRKQRR